MASELVLVTRVLQVLVGLVIGYYSFRFYDIAQPLGWKYLHYSSIILYLWPLSSLIAYLVRPEFAYLVDGVGIPLFAIYISITTVQLVSEDLPIDIPDYINMSSLTAYMMAVLGAISSSGPSSTSSTPNSSHSSTSPPSFSFYLLFIASIRSLIIQKPQPASPSPLPFH